MIIHQQYDPQPLKNHYLTIMYQYEVDYCRLGVMEWPSHRRKRNFLIVSEPSVAREN